MLVFAWDDDGREDGFFMAEGGAGAPLALPEDERCAVDVCKAGLEALGTGASGAYRSTWRGCRDEWRELEFGVCRTVGCSPLETCMSPLVCSCGTSVSSASDVGGETKVAVG